MITEKKATRMRKLIAENMVTSWQASPKCDYEMKINAEPLIDFRKKLNEQNNRKISYLNLVTKASAIALQDFPMINSSYDYDRQIHLLHDEINIGFAVAVNDGLIVANIRNVDKLDLTAISEETDRLVSVIQEGKQTFDDITGSTFTINNMGVYKRLIHHNAIINPPELAILSMYNITEEPVVDKGAIVPRKMMTLMLSADHRVIDGKMACEFLEKIVLLLENPEDTFS